MEEVKNVGKPTKRVEVIMCPVIADLAECTRFFLFSFSFTKSIVFELLRSISYVLKLYDESQRIVFKPLIADLQ